MYLLRLTVGEYLNKDGSQTADANVADIWADVLEGMIGVQSPPISTSGVRQVDAWVPVTEVRQLGTPIT